MMTGKHGNTVLSLDKTRLLLEIRHGSTIWRQDPSARAAIRTENGTVFFSEAAVIRHQEKTTGIGTGILSHYEQFPAQSGLEKLVFETWVWIEFAGGDIHYEWIPLAEPEGVITAVLWPEPMDFHRADSRWYTLLNIEQGLMIPNGWETELSEIPFGGRMCTAGSYMPWYGQVKETAGYLMICEQPEDAGYLAEHPAGADFTSVRMALYPSLDAMRYRRTILCHLEENCDYNTLCKYYRSYVKEQGTFRTLREKALRAPVDSLVGCLFVHAGIKTQVQPDSRFFDPQNPDKNNHLTPFSVRTAQIRHLAEVLGIKKLYLHLDGWGDPGYDNRHPDYLPACVEAGGWEGMKELCDTLHRYGYLFGIHDQYRDYYFAAETYDEGSAVHLADGTIPTHANWAGGPQTYLCASQAPYYVKRNFTELAANGIDLDCAYLDVFTCNEPDECSEPHHRMTRKECLEYRSRCFAWLLSKGILSSSEEVTDWSVPELVFCHYAPYDFMMRRPDAPKQGIPIPLFNLVYHDCVIIPWMMEKHETEDYMLYALLNGGAPYFIRNGAYEGTDGSFEGGQGFTEKEQKERCETVARLHEAVACCEMVSHELIDGDKDRQRSIFSDGTEVTVDFRQGTWNIQKSNAES